LRHFTRLTFAASDGIAFISREARQEAARQGLSLPGDRACVTYVGVNHQLHHVRAKAPPESRQLLEQPFILMLGTSYRHKNRPFALRLFAGLIQEYDWPGKLVFAGGGKLVGGSSREEDHEIEQHPVLQGRVISLGAVDEGEKQWLLEKAALLLYPSTVEGFGMVPFEAALAGTPALTSRLSSLGEVLGEDDLIFLESFEPAEGAKTAWQLLTQPELASRQTAAIQLQAGAFTWEKVAEATWEFYRRILRKAPRLPQATTRQLSQLSDLEQEYRKLQEWSAELNRQLIAINKNRLLSRLRRLRKA
jgi:glycosyltransferase involved in cell wall biosynthesis